MNVIWKLHLTQEEQSYLQSRASPGCQDDSQVSTVAAQPLQETYIRVNKVEHDHKQPPLELVRVFLKCYRAPMFYTKLISDIKLLR